MWPSQLCLQIKSFKYDKETFEDEMKFKEWLIIVKWREEKNKTDIGASVN